MDVLSAQSLVQKVLKSDIAFLRYGNLIDDIIRDWWKVDFEKKTLLKIDIEIMEGKKTFDVTNHGTP